MELLKELKWLHDMGFALHWLHKESKRPIGSEWQRGERLTWKELQGSYKIGNNVGVRTGAPSKLKDGSYLILIDIDVKSDDPNDAKEAYSAVETFIGKKMDKCPVVISGRGGFSRHVYCRTDKPIASYNLLKSKTTTKVHMPSVQPGVKDYEKLSKKEVEAGYRIRSAFEVDIYATGKQAVVPPSVHPDSKKPYRWQTPIATIKDIPKIASAKLQPPRKSSEKKFGGFVEVDLLEKRIPEKTVALISDLDGLDDYGGDRSSAVFAAISVLVKAGLTEDEIISVIIDPLHAISEVVTDRVGGNQEAGARWLMPQIEKVKFGKDPESQFEDVVDFSDTDWEDFDDKDAIREANQKAYDERSGWTMELDKTKDGAIKMTLKNCELYTRHALNGKRWLGYNDFADRSEFLENPPWAKNKKQYKGKPVYDHDVLHYRLHLAKAHKFEPPNSMAHDAIDTFSTRHRFHPVEEYFSTLKWDGVKRVSTWLPKYMGTENTPYSRAIGEKFLVAAVTRIKEPGRKFDYVLIFEGKQGKKKSTALSVLSSPWFCDDIGDITNKDVIGQIQGSWFIEIQELDSMDRASTNAFKAFVTRVEDKARLAYERKAKLYPRQCVFVGTTNEEEYLKDRTGNRRFWPIETRRIDIESLRRDRDQLWAEALHLYNEGETKLWLDDPKIEEMAMQKQQEKLVTDTWEEPIALWLEGQKKEAKYLAGSALYFTLETIVSEALAKSYSNMNSGDHRRLGHILKRFGLQNVKVMGIKKWKLRDEKLLNRGP